MGRESPDIVVNAVVSPLGWDMATPRAVVMPQYPTNYLPVWLTFFGCSVQQSRRPSGYTRRE
jgi:hypothetical protein